MRARVARDVRCRSAVERWRQPPQHGLGLERALLAFDEAAAEHARAIAIVGVEHAGLAGCYTGFAFGKIDPDLAAAHGVADGALRRDIGGS